MDKFGYKMLKPTECHVSVFKSFLSLNRDKESTFSISVKLQKQGGRVGRAV